MKKVYLYVVVFFVFTGLIGGYFLMNNEDEGNVVYVANYRYERMYCNFLINNIPVYTSVGDDLTIQWSFMDRIGVLLKEGINTIGIEGIDTSVADSSSFCEIIVNAYAYNPEEETVESKEVTSLRLSYDKDGEFSVIDSRFYEAPNLTSEPALDDLGYASFYDSDPNLHNNVVATRSLEIKHPFRTHSWKYKSEPFTDTPENREKLWQKYDEIVRYKKSKDYKGVLALMSPGIIETEKYQGDLEERSWEKSIMSLDIEKWEAPDYSIYLDDREVDLIISPDGDLFRFRIKGIANALKSPIENKAYGNKSSTNLTFTLVNGEIVVAY